MKDAIPAERKFPGLKPGCPPPPQDESFASLGFVPYQKMVRWFTPSELVRAGIKAVLSALFGSYADKRELQALQGAQDVFDYSQRDDIWIDYIADLGDGWDSTYTMARLVADENLIVEDSDGVAHHTQRGRILLMGGDQVYPTPSKEEYNNRLVGPYRSALPWVDESIGDGPPHLFAIPGNHDWYDGLTSFTRLFCQPKRWIGGWQTQQRRGYFAIKLPHDWWIWGLDVQLESDVDRPQYQYFEAIAAKEGVMAPNSKIILCVAEPSWVYAAQKEKEAYDNLALIEKHIIHRYGHEHTIGLAGDLHAYARYTHADGRLRFISGGGGAYLYPTHNLPTKLSLPARWTNPGQDEFWLKDPPDPDFENLNADQQRAQKAEDNPRHVFPAVGRSRVLALKALLFPLINWSFALFLGAFYLFFSWIVQSTSKLAASYNGGSFLGTLANLEMMNESGPNMHGLFAAAYKLWEVVRHGPSAMMLIVLLAAGLVAFADSRNNFDKVIIGLVHATAQVLVMLWAMWMFARINVSFLKPFVHSLDPKVLASETLTNEFIINHWSQVLLFGTEMLVVGSLGGGVVMGLYIYLTHLVIPGVHVNEVFACQSNKDYKHFLRIHITPEGSLEIFPIGVRKVVRKWRLNKDAINGQAWFEPESGTVAAHAELIEGPIHLQAKPVEHGGEAAR